jgi:hypothetical protein
MVAGLIHDIPTCQALVDHTLIGERLTGLMTPAS